MNLQLPFVPCGDLVLCRGGKSSTLIIAAQRLVRWRRHISYSHVGIELGGFILHAVPRRGVHLQSTLEFLTHPALREGWRVYRHASFGEPNDFSDVICRHAQHYLHQRYNMGILVPKVRWFRRLIGAVGQSSFCSELVSKVFQDTPACMALKHRSPTSTLPADIETLTSHADWLDVSEEYMLRIGKGRGAGCEEVGPADQDEELAPLHWASSD